MKTAIFNIEYDIYNTIHELSCGTTYIFVNFVCIEIKWTNRCINCVFKKQLSLVRSKYVFYHNPSRLKLLTRITIKSDGNTTIHFSYWLIREAMFLSVTLVFVYCPIYMHCIKNDHKRAL